MTQCPPSRRCAAIVLLLSLSAPLALADLGDQLFKLLPDDGYAGDAFGQAVAIDGNVAIVGAFSDDGHRPDFGSAYLFDPFTGVQLAKLVASDGTSEDQFGGSVAISGSIAIIGAPQDDDIDIAAGSAYLFDVSDPTNPVELFKLLPSDGASGDEFGISVAISGTTAIVGSHWDDDSGSRSGSAYLFDATTGQQTAKLVPGDGASDDRFGHAVAISGTIAIVGAFNDDDDEDDSGSAYIFDISDPSSPVEIAKFMPNDGDANDEFGFSVAMSDDIAIIGAILDRENGNDAGAAYIFDLSDPANPRQVTKLLPNDGEEIRLFGFSVSISGSTAAVGLYADDTGRGAAYLFDAETGTQLVKLLADNGAINDVFGMSVAISGATAVVGAQGDDDNGSDSGSAYIFDAGPSCPADIDGDGDLDAEDFFAYLDLFASGDDGADIDGDGDIDAEDFFAYLDLFAAGCD